MADEIRRTKKPRNKRDLTYFFLEPNLYKILRVIRPANLVEVWNFTEWKREAFVWSDVKKNAGRAFTLQEVCSLLEKHRVTIELYILKGEIREPRRIYTLDGEKKPGKYFFSEQDVLDIHSFFLTVHRGKPRKDGTITPANMPSRMELRAKMKHDSILYVKGPDDNFVPVWMEENW